MKEADQKRIPFTNKQLFSGFTSLYQNKPLKYLLYGTSIQRLVFSGFPIYIVIWTSPLLKDQAWLGGAFQSFWACGTLCAALFLSFIAKPEHAKAAVPALMLIFGLLLSPLGWIDHVVLGAVNLIVIGMISGVVNIYIEGYLQRVTEGENRGRSLGAFFAVNSSFMPLGYLCRRDVVGGRQSGIFIPHRRTARAVRRVFNDEIILFMGKTDEGNGRFAG